MKDLKATTENAKELGNKTGEYRVKLDLYYFVPHLVLLLVALLGVAIFAGSTGWKGYVSAVVMILLSAPLLFVLWKTLPTLRDRLTVFDKGFTYSGRRGEQTCLWSEIKDVGEILDTGNRIKMASLEKRSKEKISFAYKMRGLDVLSHEFSEYQYANIPDAEKATEADIAAEPKSLGAVSGTYRVRMGWSEYLPLGLVLFVTLFGIGVVAVSREVMAAFVCGLPPAIIFVLLARSAIVGRREVLTVCQNGFSYLDRNGTLSCLWDEIEDYSIPRYSATVVAIKKLNGPWINFADGMQGLEELGPHLRTLIIWRGEEK